MLQFLFGPLVVPIIILLEGKIMATNMKVLKWETNILCVFVWISVYLFIQDSEELRLPTILVFSSAQGAIMRGAMISLRYATSTDERLAASYDHVFTDEENAEELLISAWTNSSVKIIDQEIRASMVRNQIENVVFSFKNLTKLNDTARSNLRNFSNDKTEDYLGINHTRKEKCMRNDLIRQGLS